MLHDWWLALVASRFDGLGYVPESCLSYRQHHSNVVGAVGSCRQLQNRLRQVFLSRSTGVITRLISPGLLQLRACVLRFGPADLALSIGRLWSTSAFVRLKTAFLLRLHKHGLWRTIGFYIALFLTKPEKFEGYS